MECYSSHWSKRSGVGFVSWCCRIHPSTFQSSPTVRDHHRASYSTMATVTTKGKRKGAPSRSRTRKQANNTTVSKVTRKKKRASDFESRLPRQLRGALEKQNVVKEKFGDASLEAVNYFLRRGT
ncbi:DUF2293 superfamily domain-containing protein [Histoplasma capsulatum G186AR]|uniref:DUF2293 superfamily domain-containing protein n=1 Tax=Ajellomyces capsulatus TaxID=5037 RepID=A0A8H8CTD5_AJECA|nr:DUF2293 superfamily domain-containing protein [Histoplasma capsulatum]QSS73385.1 DUF2293 superfamily domain-containing protein [Histoplasma capsulatum G186AR]